VKKARILFPNFRGAEQDYNAKGKRNFNLQVSEELAKDLEDQGVHVRYREGRTEDDEGQWLVKIGVYRDADIRMLSGKAMTKVLIVNDANNMPAEDDQGKMIDDEYSKGHIRNGDVMVEFHVSKNTRVVTAAPYLRVDTMIIPIRKSRLLEEFEDYDDEETPFDE
jgi:ribosomal protein L35AE/L33A